ncbi:MAG: cytochrome b562 [Verrucomicrobiota bacterium]|nr:cytochrome b562 [Verrucomicrobiota bacterium]
MKLKVLLTLLATVTFSISAVAVEEDTPLTKEMSAMNKNLRLLKRQLADPAKKADNLTLLEKIKKNLDEAHKLEPTKSKDVVAAEKPAYVEKYKAQIIELGKAFGELEASLKVDKQEEAKKALDKIADLKEKGHKDFGVDEC